MPGQAPSLVVVEVGVARVREVV